MLVSVTYLHEMVMAGNNPNMTPPREPDTFGFPILELLVNLTQRLGAQTRPRLSRAPYSVIPVPESSDGPRARAVGLARRGTTNTIYDQGDRAWLDGLLNLSWIEGN
jgi:hypothetical protein